ncbi:proteinase inhibitor I4 serpin, partial [Streptomyces sp. NPDC048279]
MNETVSAVNALTAAWAQRTRQGTVFSAAGVWPLLAFLAEGAAGPARDELTRAVGLQADQAAAGARELLGGLASMHGVGAAGGAGPTRPTAKNRQAR